VSSARLAFRLSAAVLIAASLVARPVAIHSSQKPSGYISVKQILEKNLAAIGGIENLRAAETLSIHGQFGTPSTNSMGDFLYLYRSPDTDALELDWVSHGQFAIGRNNQVPFVRRLPGPVRVVNGISAPMILDAWRCLFESDFAPYTSADVAGITELHKKWTFIVRLVPKAGEPQLRYYDSESFLLVRADLIQKFRDRLDGPDKSYRVETDFEDYRSVDNLRLPHRLDAFSGSFGLEFRVISIRPNVVVADSKFVGD
jgi:hypothetical protein